jgi:phytoene dehydrogenase-like protein
MNKSVIIIGGGIAGLSAGCYCRMNGFDATIFEMDSRPGGLCTSWKRGDYTFDGCLHWLIGSSKGSSLNKYWLELGALKDKQVITMDQFARFENAEGRSFTIYSNIDRLEQHMLEIAPEDSSFIKIITGAMRKLTGFEMPPDKAPELYTMVDLFKFIFTMAPKIGYYNKWNKISMHQLAQNFTNPLLRKAFENMWFPEFSSVFMLMTIASTHKGDGGYVLGGSLPISKSIEKRFLDLGGKIQYKSRVAKIIVEKNRAAGIKLEDGTEYRADYVISAADGHSTIFDMLDGKYLNEKIKGYYDTLPIFQPLVYVSLGVNRSFDDIPQIISGIDIALEKPVEIAGKEWDHVPAHIYNFDPMLAPNGKTVITIMFESNFKYWEELRKDMEKYRAEKEKIAATVIEVLDRRFPGLAQQVEMKDVATPYTFYRYTGNWQGSFEGWLITPEHANDVMRQKLPGLDNFYMAGQWVMQGGGLPSGAITGRWAAQLICSQERKRFTTTLPGL